MAYRQHFTTALAVASMVFSTSILATREMSMQLAFEAKELLDAHFGSQDYLRKAAALLSRALEEDSTDATVWVQAARLTVKGGHVVASQFHPGSLDAYGELLDRALSLDPENAKAHILKAEFYYFKGDSTLERSELDKALAIGTKDPWLLIGYARHFVRVRDAERALSYYSEARARGPGATLEERNAFIASLFGLASFAATSEDRATLRSLAELTRKERDPRDAWALGNFADLLITAGMFDDAISLSREALSTMSYGAGRLTLAAALYGKAAELTANEQRTEATRLVEEARSFGFSKESILSRYIRNGPTVTNLLPTLQGIVE